MPGRSKHASSRQVAQRAPRAGGGLGRAAAAVHSGAAGAQNSAGAAGVAANHVLSRAARPLARTSGPLARVHAAGERAARGASQCVADATDGARNAVNGAAEAAVRTAGGTPQARELADIVVGVFEAAAAAPVFVAQALHAGYAVANAPAALISAKPNKLKPNKPKPPKYSHHWVDGKLTAIKPALDPNGKPYKPPPGYPVARQHRSSSSAKRKLRK